MQITNYDSEWQTNIANNKLNLEIPTNNTENKKQSIFRFARFINSFQIYNVFILEVILFSFKDPALKGYSLLLVNSFQCQKCYIIKLTYRLQLIYNMEINFKWGYNSCSKFDAVENETITTTFKYHVWKKFISVRIVLCLSYRLSENRRGCVAL